MRKNLKPKAYVYPLPVLVVAAYDEGGVPNAMTAAWGTVCDTTQVAICLSSSHKTVKNLLQTKAFSVAIADKDNVVQADYVGVVSGNQVCDKLAKTGWQVTKGEFVNAPVIENLPLVLECKLVIQHSRSIDSGRKSDPCRNRHYGHGAVGWRVRFRSL